MEMPFGGMPPELWGDAEAIKRKEKIAEMLLQQGLSPVAAPEVKGRFQGRISPFAVLAQAMKGYQAGQAGNDVTAARTGLVDKYQAGLADAVKQYAATKAGTPAVPGVAADTSMEGTGSFDMSGTAGPAVTGGVAAVPGDPRAAVMKAMMSNYPQLQKLGQLDLQDQFRKEDKEAARDQRNFELQQQFENKKELNEIAVREGRITREEADRRAGELRKELTAMQIAGRKELLGVAASLRPQKEPAQPRVIETASGPATVGADNVARPILGADGKPLGPKKGAAPLSATAQKELFEAEDVTNSATNAIGILQSIIAKDPKTNKSQNDLAYEGGTAAARAKVMSVVPGQYAGENASVDLQNKVTGQALENLKAIFGGMPTEGERKILLEMQGSLTQKASQREEIFKRAIKLAETRLKYNQEKAKRLREGTFFGTGAATNQDGAQPDDPLGMRR